MQKQQTKNLKYYWDNRYSYIVNFVRGNDYLWIKRIILTVLALTISCVYKEGLPSNNLVLSVSFVATAIVSIIYFLFLDKKEFMKRLVLFVCLFVCLFICLFPIAFTVSDYPGLIYNTQYLWGAFASLYIMFYICFLSVYAVIFSFVPENHFSLVKVKNVGNNYILTFIILIFGYLPSLMYVLTGSKILF